MLLDLFSADELAPLIEQLGYPFEHDTIPRNVDHCLDRTSPPRHCPITVAYRGNFRDVAPGDTYEFRLLKPEQRDRDENRAARASAAATPQLTEQLYDAR